MKLSWWMLAEAGLACGLVLSARLLFHFFQL